MQRFVSQIVSVLFYLYLAMLMVPSAGLAMERILHFESVLQVNRDASLTVTETITVLAEGLQIRRGIYRDLPMLQTNAYGTDYAVKLEIKSVRRNGSPEPYFTEIGSRNIRVYIGEKDVFLQPGHHEYEITYTVGQQLAFLKQYDELAWNVTGNDWRFPIDKVRATVKLPAGAEALHWTAYTGAVGATGKAFAATRDQHGGLLFTTTRRLQSGEGLTLAVAWPKGHMEKPDYLPQHTPPQERILDYDTRARVSEDGFLDVTETIRVICGPEMIYGGLWRAFSRFRESPFGNTRERSRKRVIKVTACRMDGMAVPHRITKSPYTLHVHWGPQAHYLTLGEHVFTLRYRVDRQIDRGAKGEYLLWKAQGHGWRYPIERAQVVVKFPPGARLIQPEENTKADTPVKSRQVVEPIQNTTVRVHSKNILTSGQSLLVKLSWPAGTFRPPSLIRKLHYSFLDYFYTHLGGLALLLVLAYFLIVWHLIGRDPKKGTIFPRFRPPDGLSPAAVRYLDQRGEDNTLLSLSIINLAVNGWLRIREVNGTYELEQHEGSGHPPAGEEKWVLTQLFKTGTPLELKVENHHRFIAARRALHNSLKKSFGKGYFSNNYVWLFLGGLLSLAPQGLVTVDSSKVELGILLAVGLAICSVATAIIGFFTFQAWRRLFAGHTRLFAVLGLTLLLTLPILTLEYMLISMFAGLIPLMGLLIFLLAPILVAIFFQLLRAYTTKGREVMDRIKGFALYLETTGEDRLRSLQPPQKTPELFEKYLPYAQALELEQPWCERFAEILQAASRDPAMGYSPGWYAGASWTPDTSSRFVENFTSRFGRSLSSASSPPRSRSWSGGGGSRFSGGGFSRGGGFSGGGGGGRGGGGW